jgi:iron complex transport system substrate-binding protein
MTVLALLLGACGSTNELDGEGATAASPGSTASSPSESPSPDDASALQENATHIVSTVVGDVEIPSSPQRIIVDWNIGHLLALGVTPVGVPYSLLDYGVFLKELLPDTVEDIGSHQEVSLEKMMSLDPDLIITWDAKLFETYSKIAPTLVFNTNQYNSIDEEVKALGEMLNLQEEAAIWNKTFDERVNAARKKVSEAVPAGATFTIVEYNWDSTVLVMGNSGNRGGKAVYDLLGLTPTPKVKEDIIDKNEWSLTISWELLDQYTGDYIIDLRAHDGTQKRSDNIWSSLPAVKNNNVYEFNLRKYFNDDPISFISQAEEIADSIANGQHSTP